MGATLLNDLHKEVLASWVDLWPAATSWTRVRAASRVTLEALLVVFEHGDLDEYTLERVGERVLAGTSTLDEANELLRAIQVIGVGRLTDLLADRIGLTHEERWELQREASVLGPALLGLHEAPEAWAIDALLADLERSGPDLR